MKAVLNMIRKRTLLEKPACLKMIFTSFYIKNDCFYFGVSRKITPFSLVLYHFVA